MGRGKNGKGRNEAAMRIHDEWASRFSRHDDRRSAHHLQLILTALGGGAHNSLGDTMTTDAAKIILLVEDNEDDVFLVERTLKQAGCTNPLHLVSDGQEAVDYLSGTGRFADRDKFPFPSLVLLDLQLPYRSGLDILAWMRQEGMLTRTTVAVLTGSNEPNDLKRAYDLGTNTYLVKPPTPQMIYDIVKQFKLDWLTCNAAPSPK